MSEPSEGITKRCTKCQAEKPEEAFEMQPSVGRRRAECRDCRKASNQEYLARRRLNPPQHKSETKQCKTCGETKAISEFSPNGPGIVRARCRVCEDVRLSAIRETKRGDNRRIIYQPFTNEQGILVKECSKCHVEKNTNEFYLFNGKLRAWCISCVSDVQKERRANDPEKYRAITRKSAREHRETRRNWMAANREHMRQYARRYRHIHREKFRIQDQIRNSREVRRHQIREQSRLWAKNNPDKHSAKIARYRTRKSNAAQIELINRDAIIERDKWTCYLCGKICTSEDVTLDHVVPLFLGGTHTEDNLRVACRSCNCSKGAKPLDDFLKFKWESAS